MNDHPYPVKVEGGEDIKRICENCIWFDDSHCRGVAPHMEEQPGGRGRSFPAVWIDEWCKEHEHESDWEDFSRKFGLKNNNID